MVFKVIDPHSYPCGHPRTAENSLNGGKSGLKCRTCSYARRKAKYAAKKAAGLIEQKHKTTCRRGHPFTPENTKIAVDGKYVCLTCQQLHPRIASSETFNCGHPRTPENTHTQKKGAYIQARCAKCRDERRRQRWHERAKRGLNKRKQRTHCKNGHELTPDNVRHSPGGEHRKNYTLCIKCERKKLRQRRKPKLALVKAPKLNHLCSKGHLLEGDNLLKATTGIKCRTCRNAYYRDYQYRRTHGLPIQKKIVTFGWTMEQKLAHWSTPADANGCIIWRGPLNRNSPELRVKRGPNLVSRVALWEKANGTTFPDKHMPHMRCGNPLCITPDHVAALTMEEFWIATGAAEKTQKTLRKYHANRSQYVGIAASFIPKIRKSLRNRFGALGQNHVEDIIQEVLLKAYLMYTETGKEVENPQAWTLLAANNMMIDVLRKRRDHRYESIDHTETVVDGEEDSYTRDIPAPELADPLLMLEHIERETLMRKRLVARIGKLPERQRRTLYLRIDRDFSQQEIATAMKISENTVEQHLQKARRQVLRVKQRTARTHII